MCEWLQLGWSWPPCLARGGSLPNNCELLAGYSKLAWELHRDEEHASRHLMEARVLTVGENARLQEFLEYYLIDGLIMQR